MARNNLIADVAPEVARWRLGIHASPELAFHEHQTAAFVAQQVRSFGLEVHEDIAGTDVIGHT